MSGRATATQRRRGPQGLRLVTRAPLPPGAAARDREAAPSPPPLFPPPLRATIARRAARRLRRGEPVILFTPRWSLPRAFLEDLSMDLAVGTPPVGCHTTSLRPLRGRSEVACWHHLLRLLDRTGGHAALPRPLPAMADSRGFRHALRSLLVGQRSRGFAFLAHDAENLSQQVAGDLFGAWEEERKRAPLARRPGLLLAGSVDAPALDARSVHRLELADFSEDEARERLLALAPGLPPEQVEPAVLFSGGIPAVVEALGQTARRKGGLPEDPWALLSALGSLADEIRAAVDIVGADEQLANRLDGLVEGRPLPPDPEADGALVVAGLARRLPGEDPPRLVCRGPAVALLLS